MSSESADPGKLLQETLVLARGQFALAVAAITVMVAIDTASDWLGRNGSALTLLSLPVTLLLQYEITLASLAQRGLAERRGRRRLWALLGLSLLSGLGILLGFALLILPGLYLLVRWSLAVPILIAEDAGPGEALSGSGDEISGRFWPVAGLFLLLYLPFVAGAALNVAAPRTLPLDAVANILINLSLVGAWFGAVAVYADGKTGDRLADVFA
ncbi:MAG TPA: hypothetical protein VFW19_18930 [Allosphingosinicella sp.]|nr:hypothetical protein [Allosphingosinicella sp.]